MPQLHLAVRSQHDVRRIQVPEEDRSSVGASPECDLHLPYEGVSRHHALLIRRNGRLVLEDQGSRNGLRVSGQRMERVDLEPGVLVQVGSVFVSIEPIDTIDGKLFLDFGPDDFPTPPFRHPEPPNHGEMLEALDLVREVMRAGFQLGSGDAKSRTPVSPRVWERLRAASGAESVGLVSDPQQRAVRGAAGRWTEDTFQELELLGDVFDDRPRVVRGDRLFWLGIRCADDLLVVGSVDPAPEWMQVTVEVLGRELARGRASGLERTAPALRRLDPPETMVLGSGPAARELRRQLEEASSTLDPVLLLGEHGTGKELAALTVHRSSATAGGPFVAVNCAAVAPSLLEAELFGVVSGTATGVEGRDGFFVRAGDGSLFLDEIGDLPPELQAKLLRVLQQREVVPIGGRDPVPVRARIVSATNRRLEELLDGGHFRPDLYYRLCTWEIRVPPLRERVEDLPGLVAAFVTRIAEVQEKHLRGVTHGAIERLATHDWPGNVRELELRIKRAVAATPSGGTVDRACFGDLDSAGRPPTDRLLAARREGQARSSGPFRPLAERIGEVERTAILEALDRTGGNRSRAAQLLGISRNTLARKLTELGLDGPSKRLGTP